MSLPSCVPSGGGVPKERAPGEVGPERQQHAGERRMLGVVLVVALVEQLDTGGEVLRLVPGVGVDAPAAGDQQAAA